MNLYEPASVTDISDPEDKGRVKVKFHRTDCHVETWVVLVDSVYSKGDNGWNGELAKDDDIIISFLDWPKCQQPFVFGKPRSSGQSIKRDKKEILKIKEHTVTFEDDVVTISHKDSKSKIVFKNGEVNLMSNGKSPYVMVRGELLKQWLNSLFLLGNMGYPTATVQASGYPWLDQILSDKLKIT